MLKDRDATAVAKGEKYIDENLSKKLKKKQMTGYEFSSAMARVLPLHDGSTSWPLHARNAELVIEAVFEELSVKHKVLKQIEALIPAHAIFASNTSAIPIGEIAKGSSRPENVIGMHYFSPVPQMPLVEIIMHSGTSERAAAIAQDVANRQGKTPIVVKDFPGFYVNRCKVLVRILIC
jgi:enoyl-CoA hydratase/long-chain 3-hydroxyacyl-CoA dehydrogenase